MIGIRRRRSWRNGSYAVLDFETTGLDLEHDHVLSYGLVPVDQGRIRLSGALYAVVRSPIALPSDSIRVHGIRPVELEGAPTFQDVAGELLGALEGRLLVAYAAQIELAFLGRLHEDLGLAPPCHAIDVIDLASEVTAREGRDAPPPRLSDLAERYGVPVARTHHAFADALIAAQLFLVLATRLERLGVDVARELERSRHSRAAMTLLSGRLGRR